MDFHTDKNIDPDFFDKFQKVFETDDDEFGSKFTELLNSESFHAFTDILEQALSQPIEVDPNESIDEMVTYYFELIKYSYKGEKPEKVKLDKENCCTVYIDGVEYEFHDYVNDDDADRIEMCMGLEAISCDFYPTEAIEKRLSERIANEW